MATHVVWFRNDLRVSDHLPLLNACERAKDQSDDVLPLYILDPQWFGQTSLGMPRVSEPRARFLLDSLVDLDRELQSMGGRLRLLVGDTLDVIRKVCDELDVQSFSWYREVATEESHVARKLHDQLSELNIACQEHSPCTMTDWDQVPFSIEDTPEVFTKFRRLVEKRGVFPKPRGNPSPFKTCLRPLSREIAAEGLSVDEVCRLDFLDPVFRSKLDSAATLFSGGAAAGRTRLKHYLWDTDALSTYKETRNGMLDADDSSKLSSWLALGCLSARQVLDEVNHYEKERVKNDSTYWLKFELLWRDFFIFMSAKHGANLYRSSGIQNKVIDWVQDPTWFEAWKKGMTGYPLIDANMRELRHTGYMSNRGRQNVASFLTKNLGLDWRLGAEWFESCLIDHDPSLNYGNWNYAAGIGNDAREFRWFNTNKQAATYDPNGDYVRHWIPELRKVHSEWIHTPWRMSESAQETSRCVIGRDYPEPIVDLFQSAEVNRIRHDQPNRRNQRVATQSMLNF